MNILRVVEVLSSIALGLARLRDALEEWAPLVAALRNPEIRDELSVELWQEIGEPVMPQLRPLPASVASLDVSAFQGGPNLVELLEALPINESARRVRVLEDHAALIEALDEACTRARLSAQEAQMWHLARHEGCSIRDVALRNGWSIGHAHRVRQRMLTKVRTASLSHPPALS
jgi:hypothetical protein